MKFFNVYFFGPSYWKLGRGIRVHFGRRWHLIIKLERWGKFGCDWFTDAQRAYDFGFVVVFDHGKQT